tara:strand:- start:4578 stop:5360 length:783 start_codon:yes stop_codon:yes gene_type:complete
LKHTEIEKNRYNKRSKHKIDNLQSLNFDIVGSEQENIIFSSPYIYFENQIESHIDKNHLVLELCGGDGCYSLFTAKKCKKIYSTDISSESIEIGKIRAKKMKINNISFEVMNAEKIKYNDDMFDLVTIVSSLSYLKLDNALSEVSRVLKNDGKLIIVDSFNHNIFYRINRFIHYLKGERTWYVIKNIPDKKTLRKISNKFDLINIKYFGIFIFISPLLKLFFSEIKTKQIIDKLDHLFRFFKKYSFKIVITAKKIKKMED